MRLYPVAEPKTKAPLARLQEMAEEEEAKATATAMSKVGFGVKGWRIRVCCSGYSIKG